MRIDIRDCDDWVAVYKDGVKVFEGHSCSLAQGLEALGITFWSVSLDNELDDLGQLKDGGDPFPDFITAKAPEGVHIERIR